MGEKENRRAGRALNEALRRGHRSLVANPEFSPLGVIPVGEEDLQGGEAAQPQKPASPASREVETAEVAKPAAVEEREAPTTQAKSEPRAERKRRPAVFLSLRASSFAAARTSSSMSSVVLIRMMLVHRCTRQVPVLQSERSTSDTGFPSPNPNVPNQGSFDKLFVIVNSNNSAAQLPVSEAAPGNPYYNGGRWFTHTVEWTQAGFDAFGTVPILTSYGDILQYESIGYLTITPGSPGPPLYFLCPLLPVK